MMNRFFLPSFLVVSSLAASQVCLSCDVPVFRYALEKWEADPFTLLILHDRDLTSEEQALLSELEKAVDQGATFLNFEYRDIDLRTDPSEEIRSQLGESALEQGSLLAVLNPIDPHGELVTWQAPVAKEAIAEILDSPLRREIAKHILAGDVGVWVFLESGDPAKDAEARKTLEDHLGRLEQSMKMPTETAAQLLAEKGISFSVLTLSRQDPREQLLVNTLMQVEPDLNDPEYQGQPMAFPIYGRGRVLYSLVGAGINPTEIEKACQFLLGPCSCEVKDLNPGADLLLSADWKKFDGDPIVDQVLLAAYSGNAPATSAGSAEEARATVPATQDFTPTSLATNLVAVIALVALIVLLATLSLVKKSQRSQV